MLGPTPVEKLERLSAHLGGGVGIYAKQEDCNSRLGCGGFAAEVRAGDG